MKRNHLNIVLLFLTCLLLACNSTMPEKIIQENSDTIKKVQNNSQFIIKKDLLKGLKFKVDEVIKNDSLLEMFSAEKVLANFIGKKITYFPNNNNTLLKLVPISGNGLINTINICYGQHRPLVLSPDIIWMTIAQGISTHINKEFKKLEGNLLKNNRPKVLKVRNDSLEYGAKYWQDLINSLTDSIKKYTQTNMYSFLAPRFSTTTEDIHIAYKANILYGFKKAFTYVGEGGCGIPYITLTGTKSDWIKMKESLIKLDELGLGYWRKELEPILDEFIAAYGNNRNELFWKNIYKEFMDYGEYSISGWIIKFYPYMEVLGGGTYDEKAQMMKMSHEFVKNEFLIGDKYLYSTLNVDDFPNYKSEANIIWINHFKEKTTKMSLYSGIMGAKQYSDGSLKPWITWAICSEDEPAASRLRSESNQIVHKDPNWIPYIYNNDSTVAQKAIYPVKKNIQFKESILAFQKQISQVIHPDSGSQNDTLTFYILSSGKPLIITENKKLELKIQTWLDKNGIKWEPAKMKLSEIIFSDDIISPSKLVSVNSKIEIIIK